LGAARMMCRAERLETIADVRELIQLPDNDIRGELP
jgi:hypothetical protein